MSTHRKEHDAAITLSSDPSRAMQEMMSAIDSLRNIYVAENEALNAAKTHDFIALQPLKLEATRVYHDGITQMLARRPEFQSLAPELRQHFKQKQDEFSLVADANLLAIERMRRSVNRLNDRILSAARKAMERDGVNYGAHGRMKESYNTAPVTVNESA